MRDVEAAAESCGESACRVDVPLELAGNARESWRSDAARGVLDAGCADARLFRRQAALLGLRRALMMIAAVPATARELAARCVQAMDAAAALLGRRLGWSSLP